jgi:hypothetical protein
VGLRVLGQGPVPVGQRLVVGAQVVQRQGQVGGQRQDEGAAVRLPGQAGVADRGVKAAEYLGR